jgi:hypothetical protein
MERHADGSPMGAGPSGGRRWRRCFAVLAILAVAALLQIAGCRSPFPGEDEVLFNAKRFDHFTCTNLTTVVAQVKVDLYQDPPLPGQPWAPCATYRCQVFPGQTGGYTLALEQEQPPANGIYKVSCTVTYGTGSRAECALVVPDGYLSHWNSATFWFCPGDEQKTTQRLCGEGVLYSGRVGIGD